MVEQEDGEEFVVEIVNEIVESTMKVLHDQYIISQTLPYTIQETKNLLLQIIEVINLCHLYLALYTCMHLSWLPATGDVFERDFHGFGLKNSMLIM